MTESTTLRAFTPSANVAFLKESATIAVSARARALKAQGRKVIDLGAGEPDFDTPEFIRRAGQRAIDAGATKYTATEGIMPLREAIAAQTGARWKGGPITAGEVVVSSGSKQSLFNACFTLFGEGDEVLIPTPSWTSYYEMVALSRATAVPVMGDAARGLKVTAESLEAAATEHTRGLMLNSPCNPTGAVYSADELRDILALAEERDWWVLSDEIYRRIAYNGPVASVLDLATRRDRLIVIDGVAKAYAMTGWRIGWAVAPRAVSAAMGALQSHTTSNAAAVSQHAALEALTNVDAAEKAITTMVAEFQARRDAVVREMSAAPGLEFVFPEGAFYLYANVATPRGGDGTAFAAALLEQHEIAVVPGAAFFTPDWVRLSYAAPREQVIAGVKALVQLYASLGK
ncbi:MAG TPA: pyridoxal phosphate-dependent aminotransferase [Gemmatimonadaceae bacterium]|nr:pyridoxal phosphate-dependent aminotransferase [Gemmatimonadaceae bacterium]